MNENVIIDIFSMISTLAITIPIALHIKLDVYKTGFLSLGLSIIIGHFLRMN